ncbi:MAG: hypothetical protein ACTSYH_03365 [Candidatus Heimdallarchaeaceae archaeon]
MIEKLIHRFSWVPHIIILIVCAFLYTKIQNFGAQLILVALSAISVFGAILGIVIGALQFSGIRYSDSEEEKKS